MKFSEGFHRWDQPYLFQELEDVLRSLPEADRRRMIPLSIGDPDLPTPRPISEAIIREHAGKYHGYPAVEGRLDLREALAEYYRERFGVDISPDHLMIGPGAKTDVFDLPAVFANPGDQVAIMTPAYPVYRDSAGFRKLDILFLEGTEENAYQPPLDTSRIVDGALALIILCYPNNPTGVMADRAYIQEMVRLADAHGALLIFDIAYADFAIGDHPERAFSIFSIEGAGEVAIEIGSFSKPFSMTGHRVSWVAIKNPHVLKLWKRYRANRDSGVSEYDQAGALVALTSPEVREIVRKNMAEYRTRAQFLKSGLERLGLFVSGLENSPYAWFRSPIPDSAKAAGIIMKKALVQLTPGVGFGPAGEGYLRATIFQPLDMLEEAMERLEAIRW